MSLGARWAGIKVHLAVEADENAARTFRQNHSNVELLNQPIETVRSLDIPNALRPLIVFGGPPCQGFSTSNQRTRSATNPLNWLFREYIRLVASLKPEWVVFENVTGMVTTEGGRFLKEVLSEFSNLGYASQHFILNSADFGIPQIRSRLFIVASLQKTMIRKPQKHSQKVSVRDAIADLPVLQNGASTDELPYRSTPQSNYAKTFRGDLTRCSNHLVSWNADYVVQRYEHIPPGGNWVNIPARLMKNYTDRTRCHTGIYHRLIYNEPSVVIGNFRKNMLIHPTQQRGLSVREAARLQSFPDTFVFTGSIGFQQQQVGNAVPPLLARAVFRAVMRAAEGAVCGQNNR